MKQILLTALMFLCSFSISKAQYGWNMKENSVWTFAPKSGLDFNTGSPAVIASELYWSGSLSESYASVADRNGQLLFYTNTDSIWDRNNNPMPNGFIGGLSGGTPSFEGSLSWNTSQGALILPVLNNPDRYYVFALTGSMDVCFFWAPISHKLVYSVVDMSLNSGMGDVVPGMQNLPVDSALGGMMTAVPGNDCNIWLLVHDRDNPVFKAYEITVNGVNTIPALSTTGHFTGDWANKWGEMWPSPNREHIAFSTTINNSQGTGLDAYGGVEVCDFNPSTGVVSNAQMVSDSFLIGAVGLPYSVCFSPDNSKLYFTLTDNIYQVDLSLSTTTAIINSATMISDTALGEGGGNPVVRLGPDGKIYAPVNPPDTINGNYQSYLCRINSPNLAGAASNFVREAVPIAPIPMSIATDYALGNSIGNNSFVIPLPADSNFNHHDVLLCSNQESLVLEAPDGSFWYEWYDGSTDTLKVITQPGTYWVRNNDYCHYRVDTFVVKGVDVDFTLGNDTTICNQDTYTLKVIKNGVKYLWQDSSKDSVYTTSQSGTYWVQISKDGCVNSDTIQLSLKDIRQDLGPDTALCRETPIQYTVEAALLPGSSARWNTGSNTPTLTIQDTGTYWVTVSDLPCTATDSIRITSEWCDCRIMMPNAFSPNNDGLNDYFLPILQSAECLDPGTYTLDVYNRWGQRVYQGRANDRGWDGMYSGTQADVGTYAYYITYTLGRRGTKHVQKGEVILIR
jgi:gliding motility-associated-like protein